MAQYQVTVEMSQETVGILQQNGFALHGLHAAGTGSGGAMPTIWFRSTALSTSMVVAWTEAYHAFTSLSRILPGAQIQRNASFAIDLGQQLEITEPWGGGRVQPHGEPGAIGILNSSPAALTCGLALGVSGSQHAPIYALPLHAHTLNVAVPVPRVFLMFSAQPLPPGTVSPRSSGSGVLVDLAGSPSRSVAFDANTGWQPGPGAQVYPPDVDLAPLLLQPAG